MKTMDMNEEISEIKRSLSEIEMQQIHLVRSYVGLVDGYKEFAASYKETVDTIKEIAGLSKETTEALGLMAGILKEMADDKLKSAEPIRHGHWLFVVGNNTQEIWMCDQCKRSILIKPMEKDELIKNYPYCHCGAKMDKEENEK